MANALRHHTAIGLLMALLLGMVQHSANAQCTNALDLGNDLFICEGSTVVLNAGAGYQSYAWSTGSTGQSIVVGAAGTYSCTVTDFGTTGELVTNGNFSQGATGFSSDYVPGYGGSYGLLSGAGTYATTTSPNLVHNNFYAFGDHTGGGNMLVVNGAQVPGQNIWCQTITVEPNTDYAFSAWLATAYPESPAELVFTINGITVGDPLLASFATGQWLNFYTIWNSGANTSITICISNQNTLDSGNDFALDDISFAPFCTYTDEVVVNVQAFPQPDLGPDVAVCAGSPVLLNATWPNADAYAWQDGSTAPTLSATTPGWYWVDVTENGCTARDSVQVSIAPMPTVELGPPQQPCAGTTVTLNATYPGATYLWNTGSTTATLTTGSSGTYSVVVDLDGCTATDAVVVTVIPLPEVDLGPDTTVCADDPLTVDATWPNSSYLWEDGSTGPARTLTESDVYWVQLTRQGCTVRDTLVLGHIPLPYADLGPDFLLCIGRTAELDASGPEQTVLWDNGDTLGQRVINEEGTYAVTVSNVCGLWQDTIVITQDRCDCPVFVPNAFSPDGGGLNEGFRPQFDCDVEDYRIRIFDRWGRELWTSTDPLEAWDGGGGDNGTSIGIYAWRLQLRPITVNDRTLRKLQGHVLLLR